jgi:FdhD protein
MIQEKNESAEEIIIHKVRSNDPAPVNDLVAVEEPLEISLAWQSEGQHNVKVISVTMRTPGNDPELATGFLFTEGIIKEKAAVKSAVAHSFAENKITVVLNDGYAPALQQTERNFYTTSSCGVCGKASIDAIKTVSVFESNDDEITIDAAIFYSLSEKLRAQQATFNSTGGLHASALFDLQGNFISLREDVGRHNALDKVIGAALTEGKLPLNNSILLLSGRASFELVQKAMMAGIKIIAAIGAPSSLAIKAAEECGITLIGFLRSEGFNIYSNKKRINFTKENTPA